jgi:hypothetical protein
MPRIAAVDFVLFSKLVLAEEDGINMAINYSIVPYGDLLRVKAEGYDENFLEVKAYSQAVIQACHLYKSQRLLSDERDLEYRLGAFDSFQLSRFISNFAPKVGRAAVVCAEESRDDSLAFANQISNQGLELRIFTDLEEAEKWISLPSEAAAKSA